MAEAKMEVVTGQKISSYQLLFLFLALLFSTYLRISFLFLYPIFVLFLFVCFQWKLNRNAIYFLAFAAFCWLFSFRVGFFPKYNVVSLYFFVPFILLLFAVPPAASQRNHLKILMEALTFIAVINNVIGFAQYIHTPNDDSFSGLYGTFTVSQNGLSIINTLLFFYYFSLFLSNRKTLPLILSIFFLVSMVMGFYGTGLFVMLFAFMLTFLRIKAGNIIRITILTAIAIGILVLMMQLVSPATLEYNVNIVKRFIDGTGGQTPRKLVIFQNYFTAYTDHALDLLFGSGPGTFNSRSAFMVGSPTYFNIDLIKSDIQPYYFRNYAYTLWNPSNTGPYDGFMNQPFTSLLALLGEYGLLFTLALAYILYKKSSYWITLGNAYANERGVSAEFRIYKFALYLLLLFVVVDNYIEYPEIIALILLIIKFSQQRLSAAFSA
jgi:hypothetical protein